MAPPINATAPPVDSSEEGGNRASDGILSMVPQARHAMCTRQRVRHQRGAVAALRGVRLGRSFRAPAVLNNSQRPESDDSGAASVPPAHDQKAGPRAPSPMGRGGRRIGELLVERQLVTSAQVDEALLL